MVLLNRIVIFDNLQNRKDFSLLIIIRKGSSIVWSLGTRKMNDSIVFFIPGFTFIGSLNLDRFLSALSSCYEEGQNST